MSFHPQAMSSDQPQAIGPSNGLGVVLAGKQNQLPDWLRSDMATTEVGDIVPQLIPKMFHIRL
jgi:hypothetical protein